MEYNRQKYINLNIIEKQTYIKLIKDTFEKYFAKELNLIRVSAPLFVTSNSGLQDNLTGKERVICFDLKNGCEDIEIVQSLAKWKRFALKKYGFCENQGLYTDMNAIRRDDEIDNIHSIFVDQWDWEKIITKKQRNITYLKQVVKRIVKAIIKTNDVLKKHSFDCYNFNKDVFFITSEELLKLYPNLTAKQREYEIVKKYKTVFIIQIGDKLSNGEPHDLRAPDYDDWQLNGDLFFYHEVLDIALEISSMGIRVDEKSMEKQLKLAEKTERLNYDYHKMIMNNELPLTIGGGIGQSRLCQLLLGRAHIGEVQSSYWNQNIIDECKKNGIELL